jgi:DNA segregation ATPase FtsK/SpoIIIE, S-DNA-T family
LPVVASLAPLVVAVVLWLITGSPFALLFAILGPVTALAGFADSTFGSRRVLKRERARFTEDLSVAVSAIHAAHVAEVSDLAEVAPGAETIVHREGADPDRWIASAASPILVRAGLGTVSSTLRLDSPSRAATTPVDAELDELETLAAVLHDAPVLVDARFGIGICGSRVLALAVARAIVLQLAWALSPADHWVAVASQAEGWLGLLPHRRLREPRQGFLAEFGVNPDDRVVALVAVARHERELPGDCRIVIRVGYESGAEIIRHPDRSQRLVVSPALVSKESALAWAARVAREATRDGLVSLGLDVPAFVPLASMLPAALLHERSATLAADFAVDAAGPVTIDLVAHGPHAVVAGTTGSGKSELLISWVLALAARHAPTVVNFLLLDFKGGSAFEPLACLPHSVGIITDLDNREAARALASLGAELKYRERALAGAGARDIAELPAGGPLSLPRLVIVSDEFAAMLGEHPDLHPLFTDIASRGRSLGVHLILCTQRPAGIVRDGVLANADLRMSLRVNNASDSSAVLGTTAAADLPAGAVGRGLVGFAGERPRTVQFAIAGAGDASDIARRWMDAAPPRRPWCDPLTATLSQRDLPPVATGSDSGRIRFGLVDLPHEQRHAVAEWDPRIDGHVLVLGMARSGKSTALAAVARGGLLVPADVSGAWDAITGLDHARDQVVAIDDLDSLLARCPGEHKDAMIERLMRLLRDGPQRGVAMVLAAQRMTAELHSLAALAGGRLMLRHASKSDIVLAGADGASFDATLPPGGGFWRGARVQVVADPDPLRFPDARPPVHPSPDKPWVIVSSRVSAIGRQLLGAGFEVLHLATLIPGEWESSIGPGQVIVGDTEEWQSRWGLLPALRPVAEVMFDRCTVADVRALTRSRELPPPLGLLDNTVWLEGEDGVSRATLPGGLP